ncbi:MAG: hypothetical protein HC912_05460 [Saprospiraceae bacterium]|nr:hypothetical protein [Saprospiraceae bacterium]
MNNDYNFSKNLFWDIDENSLDLDKHAKFIIERVLSRGKLSDWFNMMQLYEIDRIKKEVLKIRYLDKVTLNFCSYIFNIPKSKFKCYKQPPSIQQLWEY